MSNAILYIVTVLIWGSTFFAIEFQLGRVVPEVSIVYRFALASLLLFVWARTRGLKLSFQVKDHIWFVLLGMFLFGLNYVLAYRAQIYLTSALTAIAFSTLLWMNIINARVFFGVRPERKVLVGATFGIAGIVTLFYPQMQEISWSDGIFVGSLFAIGGAFLASLGNMVSQAAQKRDLPVIQGNAWGMFYGSLISAVIAATSGHSFNFDASVPYIISLAYLAVFGSIFAFGAYLTLLGRIGAHRAGYSMVMFPVLALVLSVLFEGLQIDTSLVLGTLLVLLGNIFVLMKSPAESLLSLFKVRILRLPGVNPRPL
jgi:drug/metabolite transporter (DMT)-like permease